MTYLESHHVFRFIFPSELPPAVVSVLMLNHIKSQSALQPGGENKALHTAACQNKYEIVHGRLIKLCVFSRHTWKMQK